MTESDGSKWPAAAMLGYGTFGMRTPAGRRYHIRTAIALISMVVIALAIAAIALEAPQPGVGDGSLPGVLCRVLLHCLGEFRRYILALDELARRIQLEAVLWTYLTGMAVATFVGGIAMVYGWEWSPLWHGIQCGTCFWSWRAVASSTTLRGDTDEERLTCSAGAAGVGRRQNSPTGSASVAARR